MFTEKKKSTKDNDTNLLLINNVLNELKKHKWYFLASILLFLIIGIFYIKSNNGSYTASTEIRLKDDVSPLLTSRSGLLIGNAAKSREIREITSTTLIEKAIWHTALTQKTLAPESSDVISENLKLESPYPDSSLIHLSLTLNDGVYAKNLLSELKKYYNTDSSALNKAKLALAAVNKKLEPLLKQPRNAQSQLSSNQIEDQQEIDQSYSLSTVEKEILKKQLAVYKVIRSYVQIPYTQFSIIPTTFDIENSSVEVMVKRLNDNQINRQKLLQQPQKNGVALDNINETIQQLKSNALLKLDSMYAAANARLLGKITNTAPIDDPGQVLQPGQQGNTRLYAELNNKRKALESTIRSYYNAANSPVNVVKNSKPALLIIFLSLISGIIFAIAIINIVKVFSRLSLKEIQKKSHIPVLGMVSHYKNTELPAAYNSAFSPQFNAIIGTLQQHSNSNVLIFTAMLAGEGKSFISANLALMVARSAKSVLLIRYQNDRINTTTPSQVPVIKKLSVYATNDDASYGNITYKTDVEHLSLIDLASVDPLKYLNNIWMNSLIDHAAVNYDLVLIDSNFVPPAKLSLATDKTELNFINILSTKLKNRENINVLNTLFTTRNHTNLYLIVNKVN